MLDTACDLLAPELRPVAPQPNCPQSMKIYEDHRNVSVLFLPLSGSDLEAKLSLSSP